MMGAAILQGACGFALYLAMVLVLLRAWRSAEPANLALAAAPVAWAGTFLALLLTGQRVNLWAYATTYGFFVLCFLMAFGAIYKSISLRILLELLGRRDNAMPYDDVRRLIIDATFQARLVVMQEKRLALRHGDRFSLTERGSRVARRVAAVQRLFGIERSG